VPTAVAVLLLYPYAWYLYGAVYSDALFLALALGAFLLVDSDHPVLAGLVGAMATATRLVGVAVAIGLVVRILERPGPRRAGDAGVLQSGLGLVGWAGYLWHRFGDPLLFSKVEAYWDQPPGPSTWFKLTFVKYLVRGSDRVYAWGTLAQALLALSALVAVPWVVRRFGRGYGAYVAVGILLPVIGSKDFQGLGRYLLMVFPVFALVGEAMAVRPGVRRIVLPAAAVALVGMTASFAHGIYLS
jgi:hypothetical protein